MSIVGIVCEYNPFHNGHLHQINEIRRRMGQETIIVCCMSGNYVQRGAPAIIDKSVRAAAAVKNGVDLVLELPAAASLSSAEGFSSTAVHILSQCCDTICFGTETLDTDMLFSCARFMLSEQFSFLLKEQLSSGISFPAARQAAFEKTGLASNLNKPNDILGVEYCKAILANGCKMDVLPIQRYGSYHAADLNPHFPSATAVRQAMQSGSCWQNSVPANAAEMFVNASLHSLEAGERAVLSVLRTMSEEAFSQVPYGNEGLWRKLMKASRSLGTLSQIAESVKSKRYTRTRIDRMIMCAFLGLHEADMKNAPPYIRILAFSEKGRQILHRSVYFRNAGERTEDPYWALEQKYSDLYGLFCIGHPEPSGTEKNRRVFYYRERET